MINYEENVLASLLLKSDGSVAFRAMAFALPSGLLAVLLLSLDEWSPGIREKFGVMDLNASQIWTAVTAVSVVLLGFRTKQALARFWEGTGLLHQMRGEWFDTVSNCITFSISSKNQMPEEVMKFRHTMVRLMSLVHGSALEEIADNQVKLDTIDVFGLDHHTLFFLKDCHETFEFNKVEVILHLVQSLITSAHNEGILKIPPPILSRVFQTISRGFVNLLNAKKICDTRFPFPYAQLIAFLLLALSLLTPIILTSLVESRVGGFVITFVPIFGMFSMNFVAIQLENPFGLDANDLPLFHFQKEMNSCLLMLLHPDTDMIATVSSECVFGFEELYANIHHNEKKREQIGRRNRLSQLGHSKDDLDDHWLKRLNTMESCAQLDKDKAQAGVTENGHATDGITPPQDAEKVATTAEAKETAAQAEVADQDLAGLPVVGAAAGAPIGEEGEPSMPKGLSGASRRIPPSMGTATGMPPPLFEFSGRAPQGFSSSVGPKLQQDGAPDPNEPNGNILANLLPGSGVSEGMTAVVATDQIYIRADDEKREIVAHDFTPLIQQRMEEFSRSMQSWVRAIECQVEELHRNRHALTQFSAVLSSTNPAINAAQRGSDVASLIPAERLQVHCPGPYAPTDSTVVLESPGTPFLLCAPRRMPVADI